eukprot:GHVH01006457.1.p2 GENE.GHVH01006457.1~~GHVH01006457.1.p2  ORF type:complete len:248 (+),score=38.14 GHVH01006457.1:10-753(+)
MGQEERPGWDLSSLLDSLPDYVLRPFKLETSQYIASIVRDNCLSGEDDQSYKWNLAEDDWIVIQCFGGGHVFWSRRTSWIVDVINADCSTHFLEVELLLTTIALRLHPKCYYIFVHRRMILAILYRRDEDGVEDEEHHRCIDLLSQELLFLIGLIEKYHRNVYVGEHLGLILDFVISELGADRLPYEEENEAIKALKTLFFSDPNSSMIRTIIISRPSLQMKWGSLLDKWMDAARIMWGTSEGEEHW